MTLVLVIIGVGIVYLLQNILYQKYWKHGLDIEVYFERNQAVKGDIVNLYEVITNNKILPLLMMHLKFSLDRKIRFIDSQDSVSVSDASYKNDIFSLLFYQKITRKLPFECRGRGFFVINEADIVSSNLFLNEQYVDHIPLYSEIVVYPALADARRLEIPYKKILGEILTKRYTYEDPFEFRGIREYDIHDSMSMINWKASARTGELKVNMHDYTAGQEVCILLDLDKETNWESDNLLEECISIAAGFTNMFFEDRSSDVGVRILSNAGLDYESGSSNLHMDTVLNGLARINLDEPMVRFTDILDELIIKESGNTIYILISVATGNVLGERYEKLANKASSAMWILPYNNVLNMDDSICPSVDIFPWEVTVNEK